MVLSSQESVLPYWHGLLDICSSAGGLLVSDGIILPGVSASLLTWFIRYMFLCWWTISPSGIICPVVSASALTWFIRYICYENLLRFLNNVIMIKTMGLLPQAYIYRWPLLIFVYPVLDLWMRLIPKLLILFGFPIYWLRMYLMKVIPGTCHAY